MWLKLASGSVLNSDGVRILYIQQSGTDWTIVADLRSDAVDQTLNGIFSSSAAATAARDRLVRVVDPATYA